ncbi:winged helix DNA-binding domain-containing protein, partial [Morchella conica CCBAS932]
KPSASYVILIHEAISNSGQQALTLPQIYKAIERKYPYFKLRVTTTGWQSSVRHNLGAHKAFTKVTRSGKGWLWGIN